MPKQNETKVHKEKNKVHFALTKFILGMGPAKEREWYGQCHSIVTEWSSFPVGMFYK